MKTRNLTTQVLALVISVSLVFPPGALALREQQEEHPTQLAGLEAALQSGNPDAVIRAAASILSAPFAGSASPVAPAAGLEEAEEIEEVIDRLFKSLSEEYEYSDLKSAFEKVQEWVSGPSPVFSRQAGNLIAVLEQMDSKRGYSPYGDDIEGFYHEDIHGQVRRVLAALKANYPELFAPPANPPTPPPADSGPAAGLEEPLVRFLGLKEKPGKEPAGNPPQGFVLGAGPVDSRVKVGLSVQPYYPYGRKGIPRGEAVPDEVTLRKKVWSVQKHVKAWERKHPGWHVIGMTGNGNVKANDHFVGWVGGKIHRLPGEPLGQREYPSVVVWKDGHVSVEILKYREKDGSFQVSRRTEDGTVPGAWEEITQKIDTATFGPPLILNGKRVPMEELVDYIYDLRSVFKIPYDRDYPGIYVADAQLKPKEGENSQETQERLELIREAAGGKAIAITLVPLKGRTGDQHAIPALQELLRGLPNYREVKEIPSKPGEFRFPDPKNNPALLEIVLRVGNPYPHHATGVTQEGKVIDREISGKQGREGVTLWQLQDDLLEEGVQDALLIDSGGDIMLFDALEDRFPLKSIRDENARKWSSVFVYAVHDRVLRRINAAGLDLGEEEVQDPDLAELGRNLDPLRDERWLPAWTATFKSFETMAEKAPHLFETFGILLDQTRDGLGQKRIEIVVPKKTKISVIYKKLILRYLVAMVNNAAWFYLKQPSDTSRSDTRIRLWGSWAGDIALRIKEDTSLIDALTQKMLYGPVSLEVVDQLPPAVLQSATSGVKYAQPASGAYDPKADGLIFGADVGGTNLKFVALKGGQVIHQTVVSRWRDQEPEIAEAGFAAFLADQIQKQVDSLDPGTETPKVIGISWPGPVRTPNILGSVSIEKFLEGLIKKIGAGALGGDSVVLQDELKDLQAGQFSARLARKISEKLKGVKLLPYRDAFAEAFGVAVATHHPAFTAGATATRNGGTVTFTVGTGVGGYFINPEGDIPLPGEPMLYEFGRIVVDMDPTMTVPNRSTGITGTVRQLFARHILEQLTLQGVTEVGEALAETALVMRDALGADRATLGGGNARPDIAEAAQGALQKLASMGRPGIEVVMSPVIAVMGNPHPVYTPAIGAAWAALSDVSAQTGLEENLESYLAQPEVREAVDRTGSLVLDAAAASRLYGAAVNGRPIQAGLLSRLDAASSVLESPGVIWADNEVEASVHWASLPVVPAGSRWADMVIQAIPGVKPEDLLLVESEEGLTEEMIEAVLRRKFPQGPLPQVVMGELGEYEALGIRAAPVIQAVWVARRQNRDMPPVVEIGLIVKLQTESGDTYQLLLMV